MVCHGVHVAGVGYPLLAGRHDLARVVFKRNPISKKKQVWPAIVAGDILPFVRTTAGGATPGVVAREGCESAMKVFDSWTRLNAGRSPVRADVSLASLSRNQGVLTINRELLSGMDEDDASAIPKTFEVNFLEPMGHRVFSEDGDGTCRRFRINHAHCVMHPLVVASVSYPEGVCSDTAEAVRLDGCLFWQGSCG